MAFDHRPAYADDLKDAYSQQGELGPNHNNDCVPATFSNILHAYGYRHTKPSWWDTGAYPAEVAHLGPTSYGAMVTFMRTPDAEFPNAPEVRISNPVDTLAAIESAGEAGFAIAVNGWSDGAGRLQNHPTGILHVVAVTTIYPDGSVVVLNPEHNVLEQFGANDFRAITQGKEAGWLAIFAKPLPLPVAAPVPFPPDRPAPHPVTPPAPPPVVVPPSPPAVPLPDPKDTEIAHLKALVDQDTLDLIARNGQIADLQQQVNHLQAELKRLTDVAAGPTTIAPEPWWVGGLAWLRRMLGA